MWMWNYLIPTSSISDITGSAWVVGHTVSIKQPFLKAIATAVKSSAHHRLKLYQLHLFLSPCNHSIHSSLLPLSNPSLYLTPLCPQRSSASPSPCMLPRMCSLFLIILLFSPCHYGLTQSCLRHIELLFTSYQPTFISSSSISSSSLHQLWKKFSYNLL